MEAADKIEKISNDLNPPPLVEGLAWLFHQIDKNYFFTTIRPKLWVERTGGDKILMISRWWTSFSC